MSCGVRVALVPFSPVTVIGADTAGLATFSSAAVTSSDVVVGAIWMSGSATGATDTQSRVSTAAAAGTSSCWPATGSTRCGVMPSKRTLPSTAGLSTAGFSSASAASSAAGSANAATPTSRVVKNDSIRVIGLRGWCSAWAIVAVQSTERPAASGSTVLVASPTATGTGRVVRGPICARRVCSASAKASPPTGTPATVTPRGTDPAENARSPP